MSYIYKLPSSNTTPIIQKYFTDTSSNIVNQKIFGFNSIIDDTKKRISNVDPYKWAKTRKFTNVYEFPHTHMVKGRAISRAFFKLWEIMEDFDIHPVDTSLHLAEAPGGFVQATLKRTRNLIDCYTISLIDKNDDVPKYHKEIFNHSKVTVLTGQDNTGNLYNNTNLKHIGNLLKNKNVSFVTGDGGINDNGDFNSKEIDNTRLLVSQVYTMLLVLKSGGDFVVKIFDTFTKPTIDIIYILTCIFQECYIVKPCTSRPTNSEKYMVCKGFVKSAIANLEGIFESILIEFKNREINEEKIFLHHLLETNLSTEFLECIKTVNTFIIKRQVSTIDYNLRIIYNENNNYYNDKMLKNYQWLKKYNLI